MVAAMACETYLPSAEKYRLRNSYALKIGVSVETVTLSVSCASMKISLIAIIYDPAIATAALSVLNSQLATPAQSQNTFYPTGSVTGGCYVVHHNRHDRYYAAQSTHATNATSTSFSTAIATLSAAPAHSRAMRLPWR